LNYEDYKTSCTGYTKRRGAWGSGARKVYASPDHLKSSAFEAMTHGFLPAGKNFDWHDHIDTEEVMVVVKGRGEIHDEDGVYTYEPGDVFVYPANVKHNIHNPSTEEHEMIFVRVKV
jgi:mannose-6-phosphate isomerase-like protein (cupin superfamily)